VLAALVMFPQRAYCAQSLAISFVEYDDEGGHSLSRQLVEPESHKHLFMAVNAVLDALFSLDLPNTYPYPEGIQVLSTHYIRGHLTVTVSDEIAAFGGGSMLERIYLGQMLKTLLDIEGVERVSIIANTPEGISVRESGCWRELMNGVVS